MPVAKWFDPDLGQWVPVAYGIVSIGGGGGDHPDTDHTSFVQKSGDTMTGNLVIDASFANLAFDTAPGQNSGFTFKTDGVNRLAVQKSAVAETGGDAGSNFAFYTYGDDGTWASTPVAIERATGIVTINNGLVVPAPTADDHAARKQDVDAKVSKTGDTMNGNLTLVNANGKVIFKADTSYAGFVIQRADGTRRFVMEANNDDSGDGLLQFGTYDSSGGNFREAFRISHRESTNTKPVLYVVGDLTVSNDVNVNGELLSNGVGVVTGTGVTSIVRLTEAEYDALPVKDPDTLYVKVN